MKRKIVIAAIAACCVCVTLAVLAFVSASDGSGVTKANFERIEDGMTKEQVEAIFGQPATLTTASLFHSAYFWMREDGARAHVVFFDGAVGNKSWEESTETAPQMIRRWFARVTTFGRKNQ